MVSQLKVNEIIKQSGSSITIGEAGDTVSGPFTNTPAFYAYKTSDQSVSNDSSTKVTFDAERFDTNSGFDLSNNKFVVPSGQGGKYLISFNLALYDASGDIFRVLTRLYKNGNLVFMDHVYQDVTSDSYRFYTTKGFDYMDLSAGDYLELYLYAEMNDSGAITIQGAPNAGDGKMCYLA